MYAKLKLEIVIQFVHPLAGKLCDSLNHLAKKLVTHLAAFAHTRQKMPRTELCTTMKHNVDNLMHPMIGRQVTYRSITMNKVTVQDSDIGHPSVHGLTESTCSSEVIPSPPGPIWLNLQHQTYLYKLLLLSPVVVSPKCCQTREN